MIERYAGRGVYFLNGSVRCPFAGIGTRQPDASNRLALDDGWSHATFDPAARLLHLRNTHRYDTKTLIGDVILLGAGRTRDGATVPIACHARFEKAGARIGARPHLHPSCDAALVQAVFDPVTIIADNGERTVQLLDRTALDAVWRRPPLASRLGRALIQVGDAEPREALIDLVVSMGLGRWRKPAMRVQLVALDGVPRGPVELEDLFSRGAWELRVAPLLRLPAAEAHLERALFLLGLEQSAVMRAVSTRGLAAGDTLGFRFCGSRGLLRLSTAGKVAIEEEVERPADVARAYLEYDFAGAILASQLRARLRAMPPTSTVTL